MTRPKMIIEEITVTAFQQHTRILGCEKTGEQSALIPATIQKKSSAPSTSMDWNCKRLP